MKTQNNTTCTCTTGRHLTREEVASEYEPIEEPILPGCIWDFPLLPVANLLAAVALLGIFAYGILFV